MARRQNLKHERWLMQEIARQPEPPKRVVQRVASVIKLSPTQLAHGRRLKSHKATMRRIDKQGGHFPEDTMSMASAPTVGPSIHPPRCTDVEFLMRHHGRPVRVIHRLPWSMKTRMNPTTRLTEYVEYGWPTRKGSKAAQPPPTQRIAGMVMQLPAGAMRRERKG